MTRELIHCLIVSISQQPDNLLGSTADILVLLLTPCSIRIVLLFTDDLDMLLALAGTERNGLSSYSQACTYNRTQFHVAMNRYWKVF